MYRRFNVHIVYGYDFTNQRNNASSTLDLVKKYSKQIPEYIEFDCIHLL
uniref:Glycosyltransferase n=1 Tax=Macrostomum lignano TaxID=282301 RepID=A0A1I8IYA6_9PLAT